ncbi:MAG: gamma-glutamyl-gamma-aminobutyrate hydrolase family protein [Candidatus Nanopelagicales bacterium]|nr:gamma-glutamyl-gamma-aminobutyrate hydrolase family protein [Candidatus Nanopelagicales bacterium]MDP4714234.1 gamma-glutamyl-gamma-aminobutyrate hydrolase family protein [Candidatus Nanopelagicales bacterium]MDP5095042.1 gamma-glutamyl-gamma-aminobutyrate hydrolase family protein [Candidatus Nanopelagicales bacterium]
MSPPGPVAERFAQRGYEVVESVIVPRDRFDSPDVSFNFPEVGEYDVVVPMGAPWGAWDDERIGTWLTPELDWLRNVQAGDVPILGICFGAQALARALGGSVAPGPRAEIGYTWITSDDESLVPGGPWFQWHYDRFTVPPGAVEIARNPLASQAYVIGRSLAVQFHPEVTTACLRGWLDEGGLEEAQEDGVDPDELLAFTVREEPKAIQRAHALVDAFLDRIAVDS